MKLKLTGDDCAMVFKSNGEREAVIAKMPDDGKVADHVVLMSALLCRLKAEPKFADEMRDWFEAQRVLMKSETYN